MQLVAKQAFRYDGRDLAVGEHFKPASASDAMVLCKIGRADQVFASSPEGSVPTAETRSEAASGTPATALSAADNRKPSPNRGHRRGQYSRSDMRATD